MTLIQAMRTDHPSVAAERSLMDAAALMAETGCTLLPVIDAQGCLVGLLTTAGVTPGNAAHIGRVSCHPTTGASAQRF
jgi:CBS domain-containing protein